MDSSNSEVADKSLLTRLGNKWSSSSSKGLVIDNSAPHQFITLSHCWRAIPVMSYTCPFFSNNHCESHNLEIVHFEDQALKLLMK